MPVPSIVYVVSRWGEPTQTFVRREAEATALLGARVSALSLKVPAATSSPISTEHLGGPQVLAGVLRAVVRHPRTVLRVLYQVASRSARRNLAPQLAAAAIGIAWAGREDRSDRSLHAHFGWVAATTAWSAAVVAGRPFTIVLHAFELHGRRYHDRFTPVPIRAAAQVFVISAADRALLQERWAVNAIVLRMGVPSAWLADRPDPTVDPNRLVSVGSLIAKKGHDVLLEALARCPSPYRLEIIGAGPLEQQLLDQRHRLGLDGRVDLAGLVPEEEVRRRLRSAAVVVLAAREVPEGDRDGIPVALMEAMAVGAPVVSTSVGAIAELVEGVGILVDPEDPAALAAALEAMRDPEVRSAHAASGLARVKIGWTAEAGAQTVRDVHERLDA